MASLAAGVKCLLEKAIGEFSKRVQRKEKQFHTNIHHDLGIALPVLLYTQYAHTAHDSLETQMEEERERASNQRH